MYNTFSKPLNNRRLYGSSASSRTVWEAVEASRRVEIAVVRDAEDPDICHAVRPFVPGSEDVMVNGVHYYPNDYVLLLEDGQTASGFIIDMAEPTDDIHLVADPVE